MKNPTLVIIAHIDTPDSQALKMSAPSAIVALNCIGDAMPYAATFTWDRHHAALTQAQKQAEMRRVVTALIEGDVQTLPEAARARVIPALYAFMTALHLTDLNEIQQASLSVNDAIKDSHEDCMSDAEWLERNFSKVQLRDDLAAMRRVHSAMCLRLGKTAPNLAQVFSNTCAERSIVRARAHPGDAFLEEVFYDRRDEAYGMAIRVHRDLLGADRAVVEERAAQDLEEIRRKQAERQRGE